MKLEEQQLHMLSEVGLSDKEAEIYSILLEKGTTSAKNVFLETKMPRATVYKALDDLLQRGVIERDDDGPKALYTAKHPFALKQYLADRVSQMQKSEQKLDAVLEGLITSYHMGHNKPGIHYYYDLEGIKQAYLSLLEPDSEILSYTNLLPEPKRVLINFWPEYIEERKKKNVKIRSLLPENADARAYQGRNKDELRETKLVPSNELKLSVQQDIGKSKILFVSYKPGEEMGVLIESQEMADSARSIFNLLWSKF